MGFRNARIVDEEDSRLSRILAKARRPKASPRTNRATKRNTIWKTKQNKIYSFLLKCHSQFFLAPPPSKYTLCTFLPLNDCIWLCPLLHAQCLPKGLACNHCSACLSLLLKEHCATNHLKASISFLPVDWVLVRLAWAQLCLVLT